MLAAAEHAVADEAETQQSEELRRVDSDGIAYTYDEFIEYYMGEEYQMSIEEANRYWAGQPIFETENGTSDESEVEMLSGPSSVTE